MGNYKNLGNRDVRPEQEKKKIRILQSAKPKMI
jgi:hypothetical protein